MVNSKQQPISGPAAQEELPFEGSFDLVADVKMAMAETIRQGRFSREEVIDRMNDLLTRRGARRLVSIDMMNHWTAPTANHLPSLVMLSVFCRAADDHRAIEAFTKSCPGAHTIDDADYALLAWARADREAKQARKRARDAGRLAGVET